MAVYFELYVPWEGIECYYCCLYSYVYLQHLSRYCVLCIGFKITPGIVYHSSGSLF